MHKIKTFILDDDIDFSSHLSNQLSKIEHVKLIGVAHNIEDAIIQIEKSRPILLLLDIQIENQTSFDLLAQITPYPFHIIFISSYEEHALEAIKWRALDYLLKPFSLDDLKNAIEKAMNNKFYALNHFSIHEMNDFTTKKLTLKTQNEIYFVDPLEIIYCKSDGNYTTFFLKNDSKIIVSCLIKHYEKLLHKHGFFRVHRSYLIQLSQIRKINKSNYNITLENGVTIEVSARKKEHLLQTLQLINS